MIADTSGLLALADAASREHRGSVRSVTALTRPLRVPVTVLVELHYLLRRHRLQGAFSRLLDELESGDLVLAAVGEPEVTRAGEILAQYADLDLDFTDATIVAVAERDRDFDLLTLDERDFRVVKPVGAARFRLFPADDGRR